MSEVWKPVPGYEGLYEVSNMGRVRSLPRVIRQDSGVGNLYDYHHKGKVLKQYFVPTGHCTLHLCGKRFYVHRLVAMAFIPNPDNLPCVNHKDENPKNNNVENLEWCTFEYNVNYGSCRAKIGKHFWVPVIATDKDDKEHYFSSMREAEEKTGVNFRNIVACCKKKPRHLTAGGYRWRYARSDE